LAIGGDSGIDFLHPRGFLGSAELPVGQLVGGEIPHMQVTKQLY